MTDIILGVGGEGGRGVWKTDVQASLLGPVSVCSLVMRDCNGNVDYTNDTHCSRK